MSARHPLASAFADVSAARQAFMAGDAEDCLITLSGVAREVAAYKPQDRDEAQSHKRITKLLDRMIHRLEDR